MDTYRAVADRARARAVAATDSPFTIEVRFLGGLSAAQREAFTVAADRWSRVIVGDLPGVTVDGEEIDDVRIDAEGTSIDGPKGVLGEAGPTRLRPASAGAAALLPVTGTMRFDAADLAEMERAGTLRDVITHEMGHVLGFGTIWARKGLLAGAGTNDPTFTGAGAVTEYAALRQVAPSRPVPVENTGGPGTRDGHWRESVFGNELMTGYIGAAGNPLSRLTAAGMADLGYQVDLAAAEPYPFPPSGPATERGPETDARVRRTEPTVLGEPQ
ncbi:leishmanolysin-related zinc metalloendopeptidase [Pseudonocardia acaciae]|uniref:leishmanolysin-related zinc metalloendopeptidase n=1 Tax=Pseudonocardia acaciae TaxID=551276 RepID=UPI0006851C28|nr:leishmanolysin-related zinc metalloendopeptidase [Pseudonocardia acaciae]